MNPQDHLIKDIGHLLQSLIYYYHQDVGGVEDLVEDAKTVRQQLDSLLAELTD